MAIEYAVTRDGIRDRGPAVFGVALATLIFCTFFVVARLVCRIGIVKRVSLDDYFIVTAWVLAFGVTFTIAYGSQKGLGKHDEDILDEFKWDLRRCEYVFSILYNPALMATKTSILVFYLRLSKNTQPILRASSKLVLGIVNIAGIVLTFLNIFQCRPVEAAFNNEPQGEAFCIPLLTEFICSAPVNILTDLAILALPLPVLTSMRLPPRQKTILVFTFALGVFVTIVDVVRVYYLQQAITSISVNTSSDPNSQFGQTQDFSWNASLSFMWSAVEVNIGITCACIPTLKPLFMKILPAIIVDPDGTGRTNSATLDKDSSDAPAQAINDRARQSSAIGAGGGMQGSALQAPPRGDGVDAQDQMGMLEFLTIPGDMAPNNTNQEKLAVPRQPTTPVHGRIPSHATNSTIGSTLSRQETSTYFGFVEIKKPRSMLKTNASDSFKYCTVVTILFFLWGFSYGMLNTLNNVVAVVADMSTAQTLGLTSVYFGGGYLFGPLLIGEWVLRHDEHQRSRRGSFTHRNNEPVGGFKATFMIGLCIYGAGTIMFWPSAVLASFPGFLICSFVVGFGLGVLETAANPFIALCGPPAYAEMRLLLAQGVQGVGSVLSGLLAQRVYFTNVDKKDSTDSRTLLDVQWTYLAITMFSVALALLFYYMPLPEVSDAELERTTERLAVDPRKPSVGGIKLRTVCLILAVLAQWTYVAAQETMSIYFRDLLLSWLQPDDFNAFANANSTDNGISAGNPNSGGIPPDARQPSAFTVSIPDYLNLAHAAFAISRFLAAYIAYLSVKFPQHRLIPTPRTMLAWCAGVSALAALLVVVLRPSTSPNSPSSNPNVIVAPVVIYFLAEGPLWPLIFALGMKGQGGRTKWASVWLTVGGSGPAFWPFVVYAVVQAGGAVQTGLIVMPVLMAVTLLYPLWLTFVTDARKLVDPVKPGESRNANAAAEENAGEAEEAEELGVDEMIAARRRSMRKERRRSSAAESGNVMWFKRKRRRSSGSVASGVSPGAPPAGSPAVDYFEDVGDVRGSGDAREGVQRRVSDISEER